MGKNCAKRKRKKKERSIKAATMVLQTACVMSKGKVERNALVGEQVMSTISPDDELKGMTETQKSR